MGALAAGDSGARCLQLNPQLALIRIHMLDPHLQRLPRVGIDPFRHTHQIHRQVRDMHQRQSILGPQPAQEERSPGLLAMHAQPDLLPVTLVLPTDLNPLSQR